MPFIILRRIISDIILAYLGNLVHEPLSIDIMLFVVGFPINIITPLTIHRPNHLSLGKLADDWGTIRIYRQIIITEIPVYDIIVKTFRLRSEPNNHIERHLNIIFDTAQDVIRICKRSTLYDDIGVALLDSCCLLDLVQHIRKTLTNIRRVLPITENIRRVGGLIWEHAECNTPLSQLL